MKFVSCDRKKFDAPEDCLKYERTLIKAYNKNGDRVEYSESNYYGDGDPSDEIKTIVIDNEELLSLFVSDFGANEGIDEVGTWIWDDEDKGFNLLNIELQKAEEKLRYLTTIKNKIEGGD